MEKSRSTSFQVLQAPESWLKYTTNKLEDQNERTSTRGCSNGKINEPGFTTLSVKSFIGDATRLWNQAPTSVKYCVNAYKAKTEKKIC